MFGGSPISVAVPPMFDARIMLIRYGNGADPQRPRDREHHRRQQHDRRHVVEQRGQDRRQDREHDQQPERLAAREVDRHPGDVLEEPGLAEAARKHHHPGQQEDDVEVDGGERLVLVDDRRGRRPAGRRATRPASGRTAPRRSAHRRRGRCRRRGRRPVRTSPSGAGPVAGQSRYVQETRSVRPIHPGRRRPPPPATCARGPRSSSRVHA